MSLKFDQSVISVVTQSAGQIHVSISRLFLAQGPHEIAKRRKEADSLH